MNLEELKSMWQENVAKINKAAKLNFITLDLIQSQKVVSTMKPLLWQRIIELSFHTIALILLLSFLAYNINQLQYAISAIILIAFYTFLFVNCFKQLKAIKCISSNRDILSMQHSLIQIQTYTLDFIRLSVLCIPAFLSFPVVVSEAFADLNITAFGNFDLVEKTNGAWWYAELFSFIILIPLGLWFYNQVTAKNSNKPWVARIIKKSSGTRISNAIRYLNELDELKASYS